jgi:hypothetical protein
MSKIIIFNFDGTSNEPQDAVQSFDRKGAIDDDNITNILKFHLLCGGDLKEKKPAKNRSQISLYYNGVGTYGNYFQRLFNAGLSSNKWDVARILREAQKDFADYYKKGDLILLTGFSRGAALARRFAALINDKVAGDHIIEAVFDTVASIGLPNLSQSDRPESDVVFEHGYTLPSRVVKALHLLSLDDKRKAFQPTLMNAEPRVTEIWFTGAHSDVGGGYYFDGLADSCFRFMLNWIDELDWPIAMKSPSQIDYATLVDPDVGYSISPDDVSIDPNYFGKNHEQSRNALVEWATLTDRRLCVIERDHINLAKKPLVFHSVAQRIARDRNYLPRSLKGVNHHIVYDNGSTREFTGYAVHKNGAAANITALATNEEVTTVAFAHNLYNHSGIHLEEGAGYRITVKDNQVWRDAGIECDANGWDRDDIQKGWKEIGIAGMEPFRRFPKAKWFHLIGCIGDSDAHCFAIGKSATIKAPATGELCLFANDLKRFYGNNFGKLVVTVKRVS